MLLRALYVALLRLHPRSFRERFGEEMTGIFDDEARQGMPFWLLMDGVVSLFRQSVLRQGRPPTSVSLAGGVTPAAGVPLFHTLEGALPRAGLLIHGAVLSFLFFWAVSFGVGHLDGGNARFLFGARYPRLPMLPVNPASLKADAPATEIKVAAAGVDPLDGVEATYFGTIWVLRALDANRDQVISAGEIAAATSALTKLDRDGDGALSAEECGLVVGSDLALPSMAAHPVLAALDVDGDGRISRSEMKEATGALRVLDRDGDGMLTAIEVLPRVMGGLRDRRKP